MEEEIGWPIRNFIAPIDECGLDKFFSSDINFVEKYFYPQNFPDIAVVKCILEHKYDRQILGLYAKRWVDDQLLGVDYMCDGDYILESYPIQYCAHDDCIHTYKNLEHYGFRWSEWNIYRDGGWFVKFDGENEVDDTIMGLIEQSNAYWIFERRK